MYGVIEPGSDKIARHDGVPSLARLQELIGGNVEALEIAALSKSRFVTIFLHEEGRILELPPSVYLPNIGDNLQPAEAEFYGTALGPVVLTATDSGTGETVPFTPAELDGFILGRLHNLSFRYGAMVPHLEYRVPEREEA
jgi:hypothetical protein